MVWILNFHSFSLLPFYPDTIKTRVLGCLNHQVSWTFDISIVAQDFFPSMPVYEYINGYSLCRYEQRFNFSSAKIQIQITGDISLVTMEDLVQEHIAPTFFLVLCNKKDSLRGGEVASGPPEPFTVVLTLNSASMVSVPLEPFIVVLTLNCTSVVSGPVEPFIVCSPSTVPQWCLAH